MNNSSPAEILVFGSLNIDLVARTERFPQPGETVPGEDLETIPGGKGANQAAASALHGVPTALIGRVGKDLYGRMLTNSLAALGVNITPVATDPEVSTGSAVILVNQEGENCIVLSPGANGRVNEKDLHRAEDLFTTARILLLQFEIPYPAVKQAAALARQHGVLVILNPAPARQLDHDLLGLVDLLVPNQTELSLISGLSISDRSSLERAARRVLQHGVGTLVVTLGEEGALLASQEGLERVPGIKVDAVDTTAAGDAFIGGLAAALRQDFSTLEAVRYANCAGALAVTTFGAQPSLPEGGEVKKLYRKTF
jgi:ribokinase